MSRIGKLPVKVSNLVEVKLDNNSLCVKGKYGELSRSFSKEVELTFDGEQIVVSPANKHDLKSRSMWGLSRTLIANMVHGVSERWREDLEISGTGYKAVVSNNLLTLSLGYSHDILYACSEGIEIQCAKPTSISIFGIDKQIVGQVAAEIRQLRKPEPYKGKGIRYATEIVRRKENKKKS